MAPSEMGLLRAASRRAYEMGRLRLALQCAWLVAPMVALSLATNPHPRLSLAVGAALLASAMAARAYGGVAGRAVWPGLVAGLPPLLLPLWLRSSGHCCIGDACWSMCMLGCIGGGIFAGVVVGMTAAKQPHERGTFLCTATLLAGLGGVLGCATAGTAGMLGMALAVIATSFPIASLANARVPQ